MAAETLGDEGLVDEAFLLIDDGKVLVDLLVDAALNRPISIFLPFSLHNKTFTSSSTSSSPFPEFFNFKSISELSSRVSFLFL